jgi:hypothetical protein
MKRYEVVFTPEAEEQLAELYRYIEENATAAPRGPVSCTAEHLPRSSRAFWLIVIGFSSR